MAENNPTVICQILYYFREGYYNSGCKIIQNAFKTYNNDPILKYYNAVGFILQDKNNEAIKELEPLKSRDDVGLGAMLALTYVHKKYSSVDKDTVIELETKIKEIRKKADEKALYYAGYFWYCVNRHDKAKEYIERGLKQNDSFNENLCVRGWIEIPVDPKKASIYFDKSLAVNRGFFDGMLGLAKCKELVNQFSQALECVNRILVDSSSNLVSIVVEKMKLQLCSQDWDQCNEVSLRALSLDNQCLEAFRYQILELLCRDGRYNDAAEAISNLYDKMEMIEPYSHALFYDYSKVFARVCGKSPIVLKETEKYLEKAILLDRKNPNYLNELGSQKLSQEKIKDATKCFSSVLKEDEGNVYACIGILKCQIMEDNLDDVGQQLELLNETNEAITKNPEFPYLKAMYNKKRNLFDKNVKLIDEAITCHFKALKGLPLGKSYFFNLNPDFVLELVKEYMAFAPTTPIEDGQTPNPILKKCGAILEPLTKAVPGLIQGIFNLAKVKYISGETDAAKINLQKILEKDPSYSDAHILMAQINLKNNDFKGANQSLEYGLSYNFQIKNHPTYHLIRARIFKKQGNYQEALKTLQLAMQLPGVKKPTKSNQISLQDRASVYLELADMFLLNKLQHEATKTLQDAINEFKGTSEETRVSVVNVDLLLNRGDVDNALTLLKRIEPSQPYYMEAREKMATIYLKYRKDKRLFVATYKELAEKFQNPHSLILLGDAYMQVLEPEKAVEAYETALVKNPKDSSLAKKIGQALIKSHHYNKAISYYLAALKSGHQNLLRYDLAELYFKLNQFENAEKLVTDSLSDNNSDSEYLSMLAKCCILMYEINQKRNKTDGLIPWLEKAKEVQQKAIKRGQVENSEYLEDYRKFFSEILKKFFDYFSEVKEYDSGEKVLKEAILLDETDLKAQLMLADHYLRTDNLDTCSQLCNHMVKSISEPNDEILVTLANLSFRKNDIEQGTVYFKKLFERGKDHYDALHTLIRFLYRAGKIDQVQSFFDKIEKEVPKAPIEPGYNYAKGIFYQLSCKPTEALKFYNKCRGDKVYGRVATIEMANLCLNPENEIRSDEDWKKKNPNQKHDSSKIAQDTAYKLLQSAGDKPNDLRYKIAENYCIMHSGEKSQVEKSLENFTQLETIYKDNVAVLRGIAECYMLMKQTPKARNYLKRATTFPWNSEDADDLEKCWLLLAATYMASGKFDQALDLCKKCLEHNKSCTKAHEFMGMIMEKEAAYKDATDHYQKAWIYGNKNQPSIGYKLAFNYLKDKRYYDAIDICHYVIEKFPDFPKIRKDILEKARQSLRT